MNHGSVQPMTRRGFFMTMGAGVVVVPIARAASYDDHVRMQAGDSAGAAWQHPGASGQPMPEEAKLGDPPTRRLGIAVVGLGNYALGEIIPRISDTKHLRLAAIVSGNRNKARTVAAAYGLPERSIYDYGSFERLKDDASVDAVYIILPPALHAEYTIRAAGIGKHVLCEKPMAPTSEECRRMIAACREADRRLMIGYRVHWEPHNLEARKMIRAGKLGTLRQIVAEHAVPVDPDTPHGAWRIRKALAGGGSLWDIGIYSLNGARFLTGEEPVEVRAFLRRPPGATVMGKVADVELGIDWSAHFPSGLVLSAASGYDFKANRIAVHGEEGSLELETATSYVGNQLHLQAKSGSQMPKTGQSEQQFIGMLDEFAQAIRENREPHTAGGLEGLQDIRIMELIYEAARTGQSVAVPSLRAETS